MCPRRESSCECVVDSAPALLHNASAVRAPTVYAVIAIVTFGVFSPIHNHDFLEYGDKRNILQNEGVKVGLGAEGTAFAFEVGNGYAWHPVAWLSMQASRDRHDLLNPSPWHFTNLALHIATSLLLLFALSRMTGHLWPSAFVAMVHALHPLQVETIAWASARPEALAQLFFAATLCAWALHVERPGPLRYVAVLVLATLGALSGPGFAALPFVLLVLDVWPLGRLGLGGVRTGTLADRPAPTPARLLLEKAPLLVIGVAGAVTAHLASLALENPWSSDATLGERLVRAPIEVLVAARRVLWPSDLAFTHPTPLQMGQPADPVWLGVLALLFIVGLAVLFARMGERGRPLLAGWLWFVVLALPASGLLPSLLRMLHDRDLGLALVGIAGMVAAAGWVVAVHLPRSDVVAGVLAALVALGLGVTARAQTAVWRDTDALFDHALAVNERDAMAHYYKGMRLMGGGFDTAGVFQLERAVEIRPDHAHARLALGQLLLADDQPREALVHLRVAVAGLPESGAVRGLLAAALLAVGEVREALAEMDAAVARQPDSASLRFDRARLYEAMGDLDAAIDDYRRAVELDPGHGQARAYLGRLERAKAREGEAGSLPPDHPAPATEAPGAS